MTKVPFTRRDPPTYPDAEAAPFENVSATGSKIPIFEEPFGKNMMFPVGPRTPPDQDPSPSAVACTFDQVPALGLKVVTFPDMYGTKTTFPSGSKTEPMNES
jgi:hypothetical protein